MSKSDTTCPLSSNRATSAADPVKLVMDSTLMVPLDLFKIASISLTSAAVSEIIISPLIAWIARPSETLMVSATLSPTVTVKPALTTASAWSVTEPVPVKVNVSTVDKLAFNSLEPELPAASIVAVTVVVVTVLKSADSEPSRPVTAVVPAPETPATRSASAAVKLNVEPAATVTELPGAIVAPSAMVAVDEPETATKSAVLKFAVITLSAVKTKLTFTVVAVTLLRSAEGAESKPVTATVPAPVIEAATSAVAAVNDNPDPAATVIAVPVPKVPVLISKTSFELLLSATLIVSRVVKLPVRSTAPPFESMSAVTVNEEAKLLKFAPGVAANSVISTEPAPVTGPKEAACAAVAFKVELTEPPLTFVILPAVTAVMSNTPSLTTNEPAFDKLIIDPAANVILSPASPPVTGSSVMSKVRLPEVRVTSTSSDISVSTEDPESSPLITKLPAPVALITPAPTAAITVPSALVTSKDTVSPALIFKVFANKFVTVAVEVPFENTTSAPDTVAVMT